MRHPHRAFALLSAALAAAVPSSGTSPAVAVPVSTQAVVIEYSTYIPGDVRHPLDLAVVEGEPLIVVNVDPIGGNHTITSYEFGDNGPAFSSGVLNNPGAAIVGGVDRLPPGSYRFFCEFHSWDMQGILTVTPRPA